MVIYVDESGSINNRDKNEKYFIIALVNAINKKALKRAYKRFVSGNLQTLSELDKKKIHPQKGKVLREGGKMFVGDSFKELKGSQLDREMKQKFVEFFIKKPTFEVYYIKIANDMLTDTFCKNTARVFNYTFKLAIEFFIRKGLLPNEDCSLQLDERNEKTETKYFLENYLNTELFMNGTALGRFDVTYYDSADNYLIQIADVFANLYYSHLKTGGYDEEMKQLIEKNILKYVFEFPASSGVGTD